MRCACYDGVHAPAADARLLLRHPPLSPQLLTRAPLASRKGTAMATRQLSKLVPALLATSRGLSCSTCGKAGLQAMMPAVSCLSNLPTDFRTVRGLHFSALLKEEAVSSQSLPKLFEPPRKFRTLADKELWHEAWMYEDRFGTEDSPIVVPSLEGQRIIGVTDPEDDNLVVWGILKDGEPPRQFIENGEFYVLKTVPYVAKVGDILDYIAASDKTPISA